MNVSLEKLGIKSTGVVPSEPTTGWKVVGVNELFTREGKLDWCKNHDPVDVIGYSIWVIEVKE